MVVSSQSSYPSQKRPLVEPIELLEPLECLEEIVSWMDK